MTAFYNDNDRYAAEWLENLITCEFIPRGTVDRRSIKDIMADDLVSYGQCHFFAGIGGWPHALRLAGWPDDRPVWTGSCPCQPFSVAGRNGGTDDPRNLWPEFLRLIAERRPPTIFGEQVASRAGRGWLAGVRADLEDLGYAVGAADLCAAGVGAPHIRQRLFWVGDANPAGLAFGSQPEGRIPLGHQRAPTITAGSLDRNPWSSAIWLPCLDGKARRIEPGTFPLAYGVPSRVGRLRAYGNAIVPPLAALFVRAVMAALP